MLFLRAAFPLVSVTAVLLVALTVDGPPAQSPRSPPPPHPAHHHRHLYHHGRHCRHHHDGQDTSLLLYVWLCRLLRALTGHKGMNTASPSEPHSSPDSATRAIVSGRLSRCPPSPLHPPQPGGGDAGRTRSPIYGSVCALMPPARSHRPSRSWYLVTGTPSGPSSPR